MPALLKGIADSLLGLYRVKILAREWYMPTIPPFGWQVHKDINGEDNLETKHL